jgi:hypothetical protein
MHLTQFSIMKFLGVAWIVLGIVWLRRAYVGERRGVLVTLRPSLERTMSSRDRLIALFFGGAFLLMGIAELIFAHR